MTADVNVVVAASRKDHVHHAPAIEWLNGNIGREDFALLPIVAVGALRIVTNPKIFVNPTPLPVAIDFLRMLVSLSRRDKGDDVDRFDRFFDLASRNQLVGNDITDAWIAAAVLTNNQTLATFDKGFRRLLPPDQLVLLSI